MCSWVNFYRGLANEARERAARASNLSIKDKFEEVAKEWSALAVWAELKRSGPSATAQSSILEMQIAFGHLRAAKPIPPRKGTGPSPIVRSGPCLK